MPNPTVAAIQCPRCKDVIISRYHYDCHFCSCGDTTIDGGRDYVRSGFKDASQRPAHLTVELVGGLTWSKLADRECTHLGVIKTRNIVYDLLYRYTLNQKGKFYRYPKQTK